MADVMRQPLRDGITYQGKRLRAPPFGWIEVNATAYGTPWEAGVSHAAKPTISSATGRFAKTDDDVRRFSHPNWRKSEDSCAPPTLEALANGMLQPFSNVRAF
jgi:hypothetical protein